MGFTDFRFRHTWRFGGPIEGVLPALADLDRYPTWWPQFRSVRRIDEDHAVALIHSVLPLSLEVVFGRVVARADEGLLDVRLSGHLDGSAQWRVQRTGRMTVVDFRQDVRAQTRLLTTAAALSHPALSLNHAVMMRAGERGLAQRLGIPLAR
jgi:hypothetical protein